MTGPYEEPDTRREPDRMTSRPSPGREATPDDFHTAEQENPRTGNGIATSVGNSAAPPPVGARNGAQHEPSKAGYVDPETTPSGRVPNRPVSVEPAEQPGEHPPPSYVDPSSTGAPPVTQSGPYVAPPGQQVVYPPSGGGTTGPFPAANDQQYYSAGQSVPPFAHLGQSPASQAPPAQQPPFPAPHQAAGGPAVVNQPFDPDLSTAQLLRRARRAPQSGWRRALYVASGHLINPGESASEQERRELIARINQPLHGCYKIAMLSLKGGVGKTTTTATLGSAFASLRGDRVVAVDANPDRGTLSQKIPLETTATVRHLLRDAPRISRYSDIRSYTSQGPSRLEILASEQDPAVSEAFSEDDYRRTITLLEHFYNVVLTDCGTGLMHSAMKGVLEVADSLVIVSSGSVDGARSAAATIDWLDAHGYGELVKRSVTVINAVHPNSGKVDVDKLVEHFAARCRAVCRIPFDPHLEEGAEVELDQLNVATRAALLELAAIVADDFPQAGGRRLS